MIATIRSEWIKLRTVRSNVTTAIVATVISLAISLLSVTFMGESNIDSGTLPGLIVGWGPVAVLLIGVIGVLCITQEYSQGTIRLTLVATPSRLRVYLAKAVVVATVGAALTGAIVLLGNVVGSAIIDARDVPALDSNPDATPAFLAMILMGTVVAMLGMAIGALTRNPPSAITILVLWPLLVEGIVGGLISLALDDDVARWMPFQSGLISLSLELPEDGFGRWGSLGYFAAWVLFVSLIAERSLKRRDA
ncbi:MAG: ABC transporter permease subunit [Actinobacteria bacterium]|nr:ABC transporter permease subunit [Actinomycetota bacterium]